jgi:hypothetical protein
MRQEPIYRFEDLDNDGTQYLVKVVVVDLDEVSISQHPSRKIVVTAEPQQQQQQQQPSDNTKYRLEPEGDLYRLYALRKIGNHTLPGYRGGLVSGSHNLSPQGECWIGQDAKVTDGFTVIDNAHVWGYSHLRGGGVAMGLASVTSVVVLSNQGRFSIGGASNLRYVTVEVGVHADLLISGESDIAESSITVSRRGRVAFSGCTVLDGGIRNQYEALSIHHPIHGWLTAFRHRSGKLRFTIGCQHRDSAAGMRELAASSSEPLQHVQMLEHFLAMVEVAQAYWEDAPAPKSDPAPDEAAGAVSDEVTAPAPGVVSFADLARRARDVTEVPRLRSATELPND